MRNNGLITTIVVEDEAPAREMLVDMILARSDLILKGVARDGNEALAMLNGEPYDLLFLDVDLPGINGLELLEKLIFFPHVIFTTSYEKYAVRAFQIGAVDYLLKPFDAARFTIAVDRAIKTIQAEEPYFSSVSQLGVCVADGYAHLLISYDDINYLSSNGRKTTIHTDAREFTSNCMLNSHEKSLPGDRFMRIHRQHIINLSKVASIEYLMGGFYELKLKEPCSTILPVGRKYARDVKKVMGLQKRV